jgi:hypothetical protein
MPSSAVPSKSPSDLALTVASAQFLADGPIGVPDLAEAAALLQLDLDEVTLAAELVRPWLHHDGSTLFWSLRQLARQVARDRRSGRHSQRRHPRPEHIRDKATGPLLTKDQAVAARKLAGQVGIVAAARQLDVTTGTLYRTWDRHGIPAMHGRPAGHRTRIIDREQAEAMVVYLAAHGPDKTAAHFGIARGTIYKTLQRHGIDPPLGKGRRHTAA